jgi:hypothetical protein
VTAPETAAVRISVIAEASITASGSPCWTPNSITTPWCDS